MLQNENVFTKFGFDTSENEPSKVHPSGRRRFRQVRPPRRQMRHASLRAGGIVGRYSGPSAGSVGRLGENQILFNWIIERRIENSIENFK